MAETKTIVCLANSRKHSGRCIAGKEVLAKGYGNWIRPVSARPCTEVRRGAPLRERCASRSLGHHKYSGDRRYTQLYQSENHVIDADYYWVNKGQLSWADIKQLVDKPAPLWTSNDSTYYGLNDRVKVDVAAKLTNSLMLIAPEDLSLKVVTEGGEFGNPRRRVRADFKQVGTRYSLIVTDPVAEKALLARPNAEYKPKDTYLCISLGEAHTDGSCYKLVATVISKKPL